MGTLSERQSFPRKRESIPQSFENALSPDWIPALRQAQGKLFAGTTAASSALLRKGHPY
jgi:hypothetical protein